MMNLSIEQKEPPGMADVLANDLGISRDLAHGALRASGEDVAGIQPVRLSGLRRIAGSLMIVAGRRVGGRWLAEQAGTPA